MRKQITNWGLYPKREANFIIESKREILLTRLKEIKGNYIAKGMGRCYGDANFSNNIVEMRGFNNVIDFDTKNGILHCESGVTLDEILKLIVPHGFFLPVTPGTKYITIGGALASDIHGKNHHVEGVFSDHVDEFELLVDGTIVSVNKSNELFFKTAGGMGLTGLIMSVKLRLKRIRSSYIEQKAIRAKNLREIFELFEMNQKYTYSVAWIDCLATGANRGRSVLLLGEHADDKGKEVNEKLKVHKDPFLNIPLYFPSWVLNSYFIKLFNWFYYWKPSSKGDSIIHYDPYFYPLDKINNWNKIYGKKGFVQWQCVIPIEKSYEVINEILDILSKNKLGSFLAVLKLFGDSHENRELHFPMKGYTLALDIKIQTRIWEILDHLDNLVSASGGKIYITKDARMNARNFALQYIKYNHKTKPLKSHQMIRLTQEKKNVLLVIGANSDIAKEIAFNYLQINKDGHVILASRDVNSLYQFQIEKSIQEKSDVIQLDVENFALHEEFLDNLSYLPSEVLYAAGLLKDNDTCQREHQSIIDNITVNYTGAVNLLTMITQQDNPFLKRIVAISSIAGLRGRKSNYYYGSSKSALHQFLFGMSQDLKGRGIVVQALTPGSVYTKMTKELKLSGLTSTVGEISKSYFTKSNRFELYPNLKWWLIAQIVKFGPRFILKRL